MTARESQQTPRDALCSGLRRVKGGGREGARGRGEEGRKEREMTEERRGKEREMREERQKGGGKRGEGDL